MINIILAGVGGQGTVLASKLIAECAMEKGYLTHAAETIGMAQRGGSVVSHVRIGDDIYSPLIPYGETDLLIGFEPSEAVRNLHYLKKDGTVVVSNRIITPTTATLTDEIYGSEEMIKFIKSKMKNVIVVDADYITKECGSSKVLNVGLIGAAVGTGKVIFTREDIKETIDSKIPEKYRKLNYKAFEIGSKFAKSEGNYES
ncbi:MAG TPA: pyruvate ferredoxin oxidoreductase [Clostridiales bacterium]|nr:pyruvate ferredoxin oxidoreductase [Clostridiales bacterium]